MDIYYGMSSGTTTSSDHTVSSGGSGSWTSQSPNRRRRFPSPSPNAFLGPAFNACASSPKSPATHLDLDPALLRYTRSRLPDSSDSPMSRLKLLPHHLLQLRSPRGGTSPLSSIGNLVAGASSAVYKTPVKMEVEEDVLVMDGVLVGENSGSGRARGGGELGSSSSSSSSGGVGSLYKTEMCRLWVETGVCRYRSKCQFAHGKEELRGARSVKPKTEGSKHAQATAGSKGRYIPPPIAAALALAAKASTTPTVPPREPPSFVWPPTEEEEAVINRVLYGSSQKRRLPVFLEICPS
ncbi:uncharacterized protein LOC120259970 [Dioscorea cayenensis subsp. rotundata]|uniref:Uncharacterized protein LOC120259970 n=1 Tax=Dioscorea cayennensis subsp. rotundata TaxID=55577 RepID=A0AB40B7V4_DIOCR|nr:uncharacterized protein LOC120259970 [Dioscorea cayenensis subsp. rotundata]